MTTSTIPQSSGIYKITCTVNNKIYIGSTQNLRHRWDEHQSKLKRDKHNNQHLQNAWNKYGEQSFTFEVIEYVIDLPILERENYWLVKLKPYDRVIGFNIAVDATSPMKGRKASQETCAKMSQIAKNRTRSKSTREKQANSMRGRKHSIETKAKMSKASKGKKKSVEQNTKSALSKSRDWVVTTPQGEDLHVKNLAAFCREHGLNRGNMCAIACGLVPHHKQWKCRYA